MSEITPEDLGKLFTDPKDWDDEWRNGGYRDALSQATTMVKIEHGKFLERLRIIQLLEDLVTQMSTYKNTGYGAHSANMGARMAVLNVAIERIKGEQQ